MQPKFYYNVCHSLQNCFKLYMYYTCTEAYYTCTDHVELTIHVHMMLLYSNIILAIHWKTACIFQLSIAVYILMWCFFYMNTILLAGVHCDKLLLDKSDKNSCVKRMFTSLY